MNRGWPMAAGLIRHEVNMWAGHVSSSLHWISIHSIIISIDHRVFDPHRPTFQLWCGSSLFFSSAFWHVEESKRRHIAFHLRSYILHEKHCLLTTFGYCKSISAEFIHGPVYTRAVACELAISFAKYFVQVTWGRFASNVCGVVEYLFLPNLQFG